jgi:hypothetical protein
MVNWVNNDVLKTTYEEGSSNNIVLQTDQMDVLSHSSYSGIAYAENQYQD